MDADRAVSALLGDNDRVLVLTLLFLLYRQGADKCLLAALLYILISG